MKKSMIIKLVLVVCMSLVLSVAAAAPEVEHIPFTIDKSPDFQPLGVEGHEMCYVKEIGKGVMVAIMYDTEGEMQGKIMAMELVLTPEAYKRYPRKLEGFEYVEALDVYSKHFYGHEVPHEMHVEHVGHKH